MEIREPFGSGIDKYRGTAAIRQILRVNFSDAVEMRHSASAGDPAGASRHESTSSVYGCALRWSSTTRYRLRNVGWLKVQVGGGKAKSLWEAPENHDDQPQRNASAECAIVATAWDPGEATNCTVVYGRENKMAERPVLVGLIPQAVVIDPGDQVSWISDAGNLRVEFDVNRCPFSSNVFQAPAGMRLLSGPPRPGSKAAAYKYRLWLNDQLVGHGEVILREK